MPDLDSFVAAERDEVASLFMESLDLVLHELRGGHSVFRVRSVDGREASHRILVSLYDDQIYLPPEDRKPWRKLTVSDFDFGVRHGQVQNHANKVLRVLDVGHTVEEVYEGKTPLGRSGRPESGLLVEAGTKVSLRSMLEEAYQLGGYGDRPHLTNSNGVSPAHARILAGEATGSPFELVPVGGDCRISHHDSEGDERVIWRFRNDRAADFELDLDYLVGEIDMAQCQDPFDDGFLHLCTRVYGDGRREDAGFRTSEQPSQLLAGLAREGQALFCVSVRDDDLVWRFGAQSAAGFYGYEIASRILPHGVLALMGSLGYVTDDAHACSLGDRREARHAALCLIWEQCRQVGGLVASRPLSAGFERKPTTDPTSIASAASNVAACVASSMPSHTNGHIAQ